MAIDIRGMTPLLQVFDMPTALAFYRDKLGFAVVMASREGDDTDWAMLRLGGAVLMLNTAYEADDRPPSADAVRIAAHRDTSLFFDCPDIEAAYAHFRALGIEAEPPVVRPYGMQQLSVTDPDGYVLCFQRPVS